MVMEPAGDYVGEEPEIHEYVGATIFNTDWYPKLLDAGATDLVLKRTLPDGRDVRIEIKIVGGESMIVVSPETAPQC